MGKRSKFRRRPRDDYPTPLEAFEPLLPFLDGQRIIEPCPGAGALVKHMRMAGFKIIPIEADARSFHYGLAAGDDTIFVTNPPWTRAVLHPIIANLSDQATAWLLMDADWMHLRCAAPYLDRLHSVVSVGRVRWFPNSGATSLDNSAWYRFERPSRRRKFSRFYGRKDQ